jgi:hypothetical protein
MLFEDLSTARYLNRPYLLDFFAVFHLSLGQGNVKLKRFPFEIGDCNQHGKPRNRGFFLEVKTPAIVGQIPRASAKNLLLPAGKVFLDRSFF